MANTLVIVESPTKARTIRGFLPKGYRVEASMGHVRDLPNNASEIPAAHKGQKWANLGVNTEADFEPLYVVPRDKKKICLLYTSPSPRDVEESRMPSSA